MPDIEIDEETFIRVIIGVAVALMLWSVFAPLVQLRSSNGHIMSAYTLAFSNSIPQRLGTVALVIVGALSTASAVQSRYEYLGRLSYTAFLTTIALFLLECLNLLLDGRFSLQLFVPAWLSWWAHTAFGYGWLLLIVSCGLLCYAAYLAGYAPELAGLRQVGSAVSSALPKRPPPSPHGRWEKARPRGQWEDQSASPGLDFFWRFVAAGLIFSFCASVCPLGYFLWKYLDEEGSPHAGLALGGTILGAISLVGGLGLIVVKAMMRVGG